MNNLCEQELYWRKKKLLIENRCPIVSKKKRTFISMFVYIVHCSNTRRITILYFLISPSFFFQWANMDMSVSSNSFRLGTLMQVWSILYAASYRLVRHIKNTHADYMEHRRVKSTIRLEFNLCCTNFRLKSVKLSSNIKIAATADYAIHQTTFSPNIGTSAFLSADLIGHVFIRILFSIFNSLLFICALIDARRLYSLNRQYYYF